MADRPFDIMEDLVPIEVRLNILSFVCGSQLDSKELAETRRFALLRRHVQQYTERLKNYHIFDGVMPLSLMGIADQIFFVCAVNKFSSTFQLV